ncbi:MAG: hypothetical protein WCA19_20060 [Candidatus Acidiferrales bacterium]
MKKLGFLMLMLAITMMIGGTALAQGDNSVYFTTYFSGNNLSGAPDATLRVINDGDTEGNLYASIYVFNDSQELTQCCSCPITPDGLLSESVLKNLTANAIRTEIDTRGVIKVISSSTFSAPFSPPFPANPETAFATTPTPGLRVWATHVQGTSVTNVPYNGSVPVVHGPWFVTETKAADSNLASSEQTLLQMLCYYDYALSGSPCTCQPEDYDF